MRLRPAAHVGLLLHSTGSSEGGGFGGRKIGVRCAGDVRRRGDLRPLSEPSAEPFESSHSSPLPFPPAGKEGFDIRKELQTQQQRGAAGGAAAQPAAADDDK